MFGIELPATWEISLFFMVFQPSSSEMYSSATGNTIDDSTKFDPLNPYALSKFLGEELCLFYNNKNYVESNVLRYFNVYGKFQPSKGIYALVIGIFLDKKKENKPLMIFGDGDQKRDFIHVYDVVEANYKALISSIHGETFNVGYGKNYSINYISKLISKNIKYTKARKNEARETLADIKKIKNKLLWKPSININKGIKDLMNYYNL